MGHALALEGLLLSRSVPHAAGTAQEQRGEHLGCRQRCSGGRVLGWRRCSGRRAPQLRRQGVAVGAEGKARHSGRLAGSLMQGPCREPQTAHKTVRFLFCSRSTCLQLRVADDRQQLAAGRWAAATGLPAAARCGAASPRQPMENSSSDARAAEHHSTSAGSAVACCWCSAAGHATVAAAASGHGARATTGGAHVLGDWPPPPLAGAPPPIPRAIHPARGPPPVRPPSLPPVPARVQGPAGGRRGHAAVPL